MAKLLEEGCYRPEQRRGVFGDLSWWSLCPVCEDPEGSLGVGTDGTGSLWCRCWTCGAEEDQVLAVLAARGHPLRGLRHGVPSLGAEVKAALAAQPRATEARA